MAHIAVRTKGSFIGIRLWPLLQYTILYTIPYYAILYYTVLYFTRLYYTILYYTILIQHSFWFIVEASGFSTLWILSGVELGIVARSCLCSQSQTTGRIETQTPDKSKT